ncbi:MAG: M14 family zinc carboxypeptidase [candidate division WOR-3 bacterium]|nr:hypothetical protein [Candidatus Omnitrophota bacterium]MCM8807095.1 hypothetical protein [Candidatus Omnitrophota bacterium]
MNSKLEITTIFESGNGKNIKKIGENHFYLETEGESSSYAGYFCFKVINSGEKDVRLKVDIKLDPEIKFTVDDKISFLRSQPPIWISNKKRWWKITEYKKADFTLYLDFKVPAKKTLFVSNMVPLFYTDFTNWLQNKFLKKDKGKLYKIGESFEGKDIFLISFGDIFSNKRILIISGLHGTEFPGIWASKGIIEFLLSDSQEAEKIKKNFAVDIIPYGNPDGTVAGKQKTNAEGIDLHREANPEKEPVAVEVKAFWKWIKEHPPFLYINLHGWTACEKGKEPFEGAIRPDISIYKKWNNEEKVLECDRALIKNANPISRYEKIVELGISYGEEPDSLLALLPKKYGTIAYSYEPNMRTGPYGCMKKGIKVLKALVSPFL